MPLQLATECDTHKTSVEINAHCIGQLKAFDTSLIIAVLSNLNIMKLILYLLNFPHIFSRLVNENNMASIATQCHTPNPSHTEVLVNLLSLSFLTITNVW